MARGRKPAPTSLKVLYGNAGKRPVNTAEPQPAVEVPRAPEWLDDEAKKEWKRVAPTLATLGVMSRIDRAAFAAYCQSWSEYVEAQAKLKEEGRVITVNSDTGRKVVNPWVAVANAALANLKYFLGEFGLTPVSRTRIIIDAHTSGASAIAAFLATPPVSSTNHEPPRPDTTN